MSRIAVAGIVLALVSVTGAADDGPAFLVKDINTDLADAAEDSSYIDGLVDIGGGLAVFSAGNGTARYLWRSNGTPAGTVPIFELANSSIGPHDIAVLTGVAYFPVADDSRGTELWRSDGTRAGTWIVADLRPGPLSSAPRNLIVVDGLLLFAANPDDGGGVIWRSDGTPTGTFPLTTATVPTADFVLGRNVLAVGGTLYFPADDGVHGEELWATDGTLAGTRMVVDVFSGPDDAEISSMGAVGSILYFAATDQSDHFRELWRSDGTAAGTFEVANWGTGGGPISNLEFEAWMRGSNGLLYFTAHTQEHGVEVWRSDGTTAGTELVADLLPGPCSSTPEELIDVGGTLYFTATDGEDFDCIDWVPSTVGRELWRVDPTGGVTLVADLFAGAADASPRTLTEWQGELWFSADSQIGRELWKTDGTAPGTVLVHDFDPGGDGDPVIVGDALGELWIRGDAGPSGDEPWRTDGTGPLVSLGNLAPDRPDGRPQLLTAVGDTLYFLAGTPATGRELWKSDGTDAGTVLVRDIKPGPESAFVSGLTPFGSDLLFAARQNDGSELWRTDGTEAGTYQVDDIAPGAAHGAPDQMIATAGLAFFAARVPQREPWVSDGTEAGTRPLVDGPPQLSNASSFTAVGSEVYFAADDGTGLSLWKTDATATSTVAVSAVAPIRLTDYDGSLVFVATGQPESYEPWISDGTEAGTRIIRDILPSGSANPLYFTPHAGELFFSARDADGTELWRTDGTSAGTARVRDIRPSGTGYNVSYPRDLAVVDGRLLFVANDTQSGAEPWVTDGSEAGTVPLADLFPGPFGSRAGALTDGADGTAAYFFADDGVHGRELWRTDGTAAGTFMLHDTVPGFASGVPTGSFTGEIEVAGEFVFFTIDHPDSGKELWAVPRHAPGAIADASLRVGRAPGGSARLSWGGSDCETGTNDYAVYSGPLDAFDQHTPLSCSTAGALEYDAPGEPGDRYYLVVPRNRSMEGSHGRPAGPELCAAQVVTSCQ